jgi:hypothetical protein
LACCDCVSPPPYLGFTCQTPADACLSDTDCIGTPVPGSPPTPGCSYTGDPKCEMAPLGFLCVQPETCVTGRPFLVRGRERLAECVASGDWRSSSVAPDVDACSPAVRARLAAHWARVGLMEHASIAAFARFTLHLLAVGAPPDLVRLSQEAIGDETEHTRLAFSLASAYAGHEMGPGPLAIDGSLDGLNVIEFVATLLREGCIGETVAAIEARDALEDVGDPAVRRILEKIACDELRHAELAWRTLAWLVASGGANRAAVRGEVKQALSEMTSPGRRADTSEDLSAFGVVSDTRRDELRRAAATQVIGRCADALLPSEGVTHAGVGDGSISVSQRCC